MLVVSLVNTEGVVHLIRSGAFRVEDGVEFTPAPIFAKGEDGWRPTGEQLCASDGAPLWQLPVRISTTAFGGGVRWTDGSIQVAAAERPSIDDLL